MWAQPHKTNNIITIRYLMAWKFTSLQKRYYA